MRKSLVLAASAVFALTGGPAAYAADMPTAYGAPQPHRPPPARSGVRIGYLDCSIGGGVGYLFGSAKPVDCDFHPAAGRANPEHYSGTIRRVGVDLGFTSGGRLVWAVFAPSTGYGTGSLGGLYSGATAEATVGVGVGANVMYGGTRGAIELQPISLQGQFGLNVAATGTSMTLNAVD